MQTTTRIRTRIARLSAACALTLTLGAATAAGPAMAITLAPGQATMSASVPDGGATTDGVTKPGGIHAVEDGAATNGAIQAV